MAQKARRTDTVAKLQVVKRDGVWQVLNPQTGVESAIPAWVPRTQKMCFVWADTYARVLYHVSGRIL